MVIGYTTGVFDLFHIGHVNLLRNAKSLCDKLIVGVSSDDLVSYKNKSPVIPFEERIQVVQSCRYVDLAVQQLDMNKLDAYNRYKFDLMFVGDDWFENPKWKTYESQFNELSVRIVYFPYTKATSSTLINTTLLSIQNC